MAAFTALLGETLTTKNGPAPTAEALAGKEVVGLYFSAHWCGPCRGFTPQLATIYSGLKEGGKTFEVVFVSSDRDQGSFDEYFGEQPWLALPFAERDAKAALSKKYKVRGIPTLVLLDAKGEVITTKGREVVMEPSNFPWVPPTLAETLAKAEILTKAGTATSVKELQEAGTEHLLLYFSAHWCPPCKGFTPVLAATYEKLKAKGKKFECIFVSSDRDQASFDEYFAEMPWMALAFKDREVKETLSSHFEVEGIPTLVSVDAQTLETINANARGAAMGDQEGDDFPWAPPLVTDFDEDPSDLNDAPCVVVLAEKSEDAWDAIEAALAEVATESREAEKAQGLDRICFGVMKELGGVGGQVRKLCGAGAADKKPACVLLDLSDEGGYYKGPADVTAASVRELVAGYRAKSLERCQATPQR